MAKREEPVLVNLETDKTLDWMVVTGVPVLDRVERETALAAGHKRANAFLDAGEIKGAALFLQGQNITIGQGFGQKHQLLELEDV